VGSSQTAYESLLARVEKPGRYLGNERGMVHKDPSVHVDVVGMNARSLAVCKADTIIHSNPPSSDTAAALRV
jgi:hypothetical protein